MHQGGDKRIYVVHQENKGLIGARKTGLANAIGEFIAFVDADDLIEPEMLQKLVDAQAEYAADIVCCNFKNLSQRGLLKSIDKGNDNIICLTGKDEALRIAAGMSSVSISLWAKLYHKKLFLDAQNEIDSFSDIFVGEDHATNTAVFDKADKVIVMNEKLYLYRTGGSSLNGTERAMQDLSKLYCFRKNYLLKENASREYLKSNLAQILNMAVCLSHYSEKILSREMICSKLDNVIADINAFHPNYRYKDAFDLTIPMTDMAFKKIYCEAVSTRIKQLLLKIF